MEVNKDKAQAAEDCFEFNKNIDTVHVTDDMQCFADRNAAVNHARTLDNTLIEVFERDADGAEFNEELSEDISDEIAKVPDLSTSVVKPTEYSGATNKKLVTVEKDEAGNDKKVNDDQQHQS